MPNQPNDRYQQHTERLWRAAPGDAAHFPAQPPYRGNRADDARCWAELNKQPAGATTHRNLNTR